MQSLLKKITDEATTASIVKQAVSAHGGTVYTLAVSGTTARIWRWENEVLLQVPDAWAASLRLHGVLSGGDLIVSALTDGGRQVHAVNGLGHVRCLALLQGDEEVATAGDGLLFYGVDGVERTDPDRTRGTKLTTADVVRISSDRRGACVAFVTRPAPNADVMAWRPGAAPVKLVSGDASVRPLRAEVCADGCHVAVVVRRPSDRQVWIYDLSSSERTVVVDRASDTLAWDESCVLISADDGWPYARLHRTDSRGNTEVLGLGLGAITGLLSTARGIQVHVSSVDHPPCVKPLATIVVDESRTLPTLSVEVGTRHGNLRTLRRRGADRAGRDVFVLHGGPYGLWTPCWDPVVELLDGMALRVHQLEAPYTAALHRRHAPLQRGDFGVVDAESVADAIREITTGSRTAPLIVGHSYGGFLGVRATQLMDGDVAGLFLMSSVWRAEDLAFLRDDDRIRSSPLSAFLRHAYPPEVAIPPAQLPVTVPVTVIHGAKDTIVPPNIAREATAGTLNASLVVLPDEGHIPRSPSAVARVLLELASWVERTGHLADKD